MPDNNELVNMLRTVIQEELKPVHRELQELRAGQQELRKDVKKVQKDVSTIKKEVSAAWDDIKRLDNRLAVQEQRAIR